MIARRYQPKDFTQVHKWGLEWGLEIKEDQLPATGFIVDGVAVYFLYSTDSSCCWLENMIASRMVDQTKRDLALNLIIDAILDEAKEQGFTVAYATTNIVSVALKAKEHGAYLRPAQILITKDLTAHLQ